MDGGRNEKVRRAGRVVSFHDQFMRMDLDFRCGVMRGLLKDMMRWSGRLNFGLVPALERDFAGCPDPPDLRKLYSENKEKETPFEKNGRCIIFLQEMERLKEQQELSAKQIAFFKSWLADCPNAPDLRN